MSKRRISKSKLMFATIFLDMTIAGEKYLPTLPVPS